MKLIIGLGNPDAQYALTRHNAGFWVVDALATISGASFALSKDLQSRIAKTTIEGESVILAKPITYMNNSGRAAQAILHWYKLEVEQLLVVHDESALPLGKIRYQANGGAGGHHGIESIIEMLGGKKGFDRLRFGVGPDPGGGKRADYVLSILPACDMEMRQKVIGLCCQSIEIWLAEGSQAAAANRYNGLDLGPPPAAPEPPPAVPEPPPAAPEPPPAAPEP